MKQLKYSLLCEDEASRITISILFERMLAGMVSCTFDNTYFKQFRCSNNKDVLKALPQASAYIVLPKYNLDLLLAGIDYDNRHRDKFEEELAYLYSKVNKVAKDKTIIFFPVQAIEHWIHFLQHKIEKPSSTKNISDQVEGMNRKELKLKVYKDSLDKAALVEEVASKGDIDWLTERSKSFRKFKEQVVNFTNAFTK